MSEELHKKFMSYCVFGNKTNTGTMDSRTWKKLVLDSGLVNKKYMNVDIDLTFVRAKEKAAKTLTFPDFLKALAEIASRSGLTEEDIHEKVINSAVSSSGTKADNVKLHDDKNLYTGVHGKGGPSTNDSRITLSNLADRTSTDARGVKLNPK